MVNVEIIINMIIYMGRYAHIYILAVSAEGTGSIVTSVASSTPSTRILVLTWFSSKRNEEIGDSRTGAGYIQDDPGVSCSTRK